MITRHSGDCGRIRDRTQSVRYKEGGSDLRLGFEEGMGVCPGEEDGKGQSQHKAKART